MANNILRCWRCKGEGKINRISTCIVCLGKGTIFTNVLDSPEKYNYSRQSRAEIREILLDLIKKKNVTGKILRYVNWYSEMYLVSNSGEYFLGSPAFSLSRAASLQGITEKQQQKAQSLILMARKKFRNRERARSPSARWRREITKGKKIELKKERCELCGRRRKLVLHHLIPIYMDGEHIEENLIAVCKECHSSRPLHSYKILKAVRRYKGKRKRIEILRGILARWRQGKKIIVRGGNLYRRYAARISEETTKAS